MLPGCFDSAVRFDGSQQDLQQRSREIPSGRGVLLFADTEDRPIQLLVAANLRRTSRVRLSAPEAEQPSRRARIAGIARVVYCRSASCEFQAHWDCLRIARQVFPDSYRNWILLPMLHLIQIDLSDSWPRFTHSSRPDFQATDPPARRVFGPFPNRRACQDLIDIQTRAFNLCRKPNLIDSLDLARNCPYLQMDACPAPCVGKLDRNEYLAQLKLACRLADGNQAAVCRILEDRMRAAAGDLRFERADQLKQAITDIHKIESGDARWAGDLSTLCLLYVDRTAKIPGPDKKKIQSFSAFVFCCGQIVRLSDFTLDQIPNLLPSIASFRSRQGGSIVNSLPDSLSGLEDPLSPGLLTDQLALVSFFLFRRSTPGLWFRCDPVLPESDRLARSLFELCAGE